MVVRILIVVVLASAVVMYSFFSEYLPGTSREVPETGESAAGLEGQDLREQERLKRELEQYLSEGSKEYEELLAQAIVLFEGKQYDEADELLSSAREKYPDQPDLLAYHAETIALLNNGSFEGEPFELLSRSLDIDSTHKPSLWMMAMLNQQIGNHDAAVILFQMLKSQIPPEADSNKIVDDAIAVSLLHVEEHPEEERPEEDEVEESEKAEVVALENPVSSSPAISLYITLGPEVETTFSPDDTVFVYATAPGESNMPLAVTRRQIADFPATVILDDSMAMLPDQNLSSQALVTVGARASRSGTAMPMAGDWEVKLYDVPVSVSETIPLTIQYELK